jgi:anti-anti-sigma regulatory factor
MIRIDVGEHTPQQVVLRVQGHLEGRERRVLEEEIRRWLAQVSHVVLELKAVPLLDWQALRWLQQWTTDAPLQAHGTKAKLTLRGGSDFLRHQLRAYGVPVAE